MAVLKVTRIAGIAVDAELKAAFTLKAEVTAHPVEEGSDIADNVRLLPEEVMIEGIAAAYPLGGLEDDPTPARTVALQFRALLMNRQPVEVVTQVRTYPALVMTSLEEVVDKSTGGDFAFSMKLTEIRVVATETVAAPVTKLKAAKVKVSAGNRPFVGPPEPVAAKTENLATAIIDAGLDLLPK